MPSKKPLTARFMVLPLAVAALGAAGCGAVNIHPSTPSGATTLASRGKIDSPLTAMHNHLACIRDAHLAVTEVSPIKLQVASAPAGPTIVFTPTAGAAQAQQIVGSAQGAEVIGTALLYPNQGSEPELTTIETCLAQGVSG